MESQVCLKQESQQSSEQDRKSLLKLWIIRDTCNN